MWLLLEEPWTRGRRETAILRSLLAQRTPQAALSESALEDRMVELIARAGLPLPERQFAIPLHRGVARVDLAHPGTTLAIELDGYAWHMDRPAFERDRERDNQLLMQGWRVLRFTWAMLRWEPDRVVGSVERALGAIRPR